MYVCRVCDDNNKQQENQHLDCTNRPDLKENISLIVGSTRKNTYIKSSLS